MAKTFDEFADELKQHEDTSTVTIGGTNYPWLLCRRAFRLAQDKGINVDGVLKAMNAPGTDEAGAGLGITGMSEALTNLIAVGLMPFREDALEIVDAVSVQDMARLAPQITASFRGMGADGTSAGDADAPVTGPKAARARVSG